VVDNVKAFVGFARLRPTYAEANVGHPSSSYSVLLDTDSVAQLFLRSVAQWRDLRLPLNGPSTAHLKNQYPSLIQFSAAFNRLGTLVTKYFKRRRISGSARPECGATGALFSLDDAIWSVNLAQGKPAVKTKWVVVAEVKR
jgi:hypothetical protein